MKLDQIITAALQTLSIANGTLSLEHRNQERELEKIPDVENRGVSNRLPDETQPHNIRHSEHRDKRNAHQPPRPLDEMQDDEPSPKKPPHYRSNFKKSQGVHEEIKDLIEQRKATFYHLKERNIAEGAIGMDNIQTNLQDVQEIYEEFRGLKDKLLENESFMREQRKAIEAVLKEKTVSNRNNPLREYLEMYNTEINDIKLDKLRIDSLIASCEKLINELQETIKSKAPHLMNKPPTDHRPNKTHVEMPQYLRGGTVYDRMNNQFLVKQEEFEEILKKINKERPIENDLSKSLLEQSKKLHKEVLLEWNNLKAAVGEIMQEMSSLQKSLTNDKIENRGEAEEYFYQSKNELDNLIKLENKVQQLLGKCRMLTTAVKNIIKYQITSSVKPLTTARPTISSQESTKSKETHLGSTSTPTINMSETTNAPTPTINMSETTNAPTPTINTSTTARSTLSPQEECMIIRFRDLSNQFNKATQNINYIREQIRQLQSQLCTNEELSLYDINKITMDIFKDDILPKLERGRMDIQTAIIKEQNCIKLLVEKGELSPWSATKYINKYDKLIAKFEQTIHYSDNRRNRRDLDLSVKPSFSKKSEDERLIDNRFINLLVKVGNMSPKEAAKTVNQYYEPLFPKK